MPETMPKTATAERVFAEHVTPLTLPERMRLAAMILESTPYRPGVDYSEEWTDEDIREFTAHSLKYIMSRLEEDEEAE